METMNTHQKSLALLDEFIAETSPAELSNLIDKYKALDIKGPTFSEYMNQLQSAMESINWHSNVQKLTTIGLSECNIYQLSGDSNYYVPPPNTKRLNRNNKDSAIFAESFFLV